MPIGDDPHLVRALRTARGPAVSRVLGLGYRGLARPVLFGAHHGDPERTHEATLALLARLGRSPSALRALSAVLAPPASPVTVAGITFPRIVGLAAGMDKDGVAVRAWSSLGFGHVELGTVTAQPQQGNVQPRLFRLPRSRAIINRMGFNNSGAAALATRLSRAGVWRGNGAVGVPVGISIGKTKATPIAEATEDYLVSFRLLSLHADYVAVNVSSPNTPGLRTLQDRAALSELVVALIEESRELAGGMAPVPIFVKIAPDLAEPALDEVLAVCLDAGVAGLVATNTTLSRDGVAARDGGLAVEAGGLSGSPLTLRAREVVRYLTSAAKLPVIGVGGIGSRDDAVAMLDAGASLLQVYTGFIYAGPALVSEINQLGRKQ